ncbi:MULTISPECIES: hypothetical protein [unclassified Neptuniibacter]|uniref:hypothetical protein n=1 Tax=unclassified Neptuniibacter TaxID=2630693 RepID=UPI0025F00BC7|nr:MULTISPECIES: hypothetical protein [unclassified Neptuniibacter]|tara:strand:- start:2384 stop:4138 length:1755 start_codon:yes stop_codon:yes gene_type:complete
MLSFLNKKTAGKGILVLKTNGFDLRATVVNGSRDQLKVTVSVSSAKVDPVAALSDVFEQLKNVLGKNIPNNVLLLHISAIPGLVSVSESFESTDNDNLLEMLRWEMEGIVALQSPNWDLGWLLMGRGYISFEQRDELVQLVAEEKRLTAQSGGRSPMRFGEVAIREGMASQEQIAECLQIQQKLQLSDQRLLTQWRPQALSSPVDDEFIDPEDSGIQYLCSSMPIAQYQQWLNAVKKLSGSSGIPNLNLRQVYPFAGSTVALLNGIEETVLLTEFHQAYVFCAVVSKGRVRDVAMVKCSAHRLDISAVAEIMGSDSFVEVERWVAADIDQNHGDQIALLEDIFQLTPESLVEKIALNIPTGREGLLCELGVAQHFLGASPLSISPLAGMPPPDPIYRSQGFKAAMAAMVIPLIIAGYEGYYYWKLESLKETLIAEEQQLARYKESKKEQREEYGEAKQNIEVFTEKEKQLTSLQSEKQLVEQVIVKRQAFMSRLLPVLSESINEGVVLETIKENRWYEFSLTGRAVDQASIDDFNQVLSISLESLHMYIDKSPSSFSGNRAGDAALMQNGVYAFEFLLKHEGGK